MHAKSTNKIAITGSRGLLGGIILEKIAEQRGVVNEFGLDITHYEAVLDWIQGLQPDFIVHFAAVVPINIVESDPLRALEVNAIGAYNLLKAVEKSKIDPWIFFASTSHVYASNYKDIKETDRCDPVTVYGKTKLLAENIARYNTDVLQRRICIGRIFSFYDEAQKEPFLYPVIKRRLDAHDFDKSFELRGARDVRDISKARDVVEIVLDLMRKQYVGTVNIGTGQGVTIEAFVQSFARQKLQIQYLENEKQTRLVANTALLRSILNE